MNGQDGLAARQGQGMGQQDGTGPNRQMIDQIKSALVQGANPEELVQQGVPPELIDIAMQELQAEAQQQPQMAQAPQGLARPM